MSSSPSHPITRCAKHSTFQKLRACNRRLRKRLHRFFNSRYGHYLIMVLVALDLICIFTDIFISLFQCEEGRRAPHAKLDATRNGLGIVSLVFSCVFLGELLLALYASGFHYFRSKFRIFDAVVIVAGFVVDVILKGLLQEVASVVIVLRLFRFLKIVEEVSEEAVTGDEEMSERLGVLEKENKELKAKLAALNLEEEERRVGS